jgi:hypothetical protein
MNKKHFAVIDTRHIPKPKYEVKKTWRYGSRRHVVALPDSWKGVKYVLVREEEDGLLIFPLVDIKNDSEAAALAVELNHRLEARKE